MPISFPKFFISSLQKINEGLSDADSQRLLKEISLKLDFEDLGKDFNKSLASQSGTKAIIFQYRT